MILHYAHCQKVKDRYCSIGNVAMEGFRQLGYCEDWFDWEEKDKLVLAPDTLVCGSIEAVLWALKQLNVPPPPNLDYPDDLKPFLKREVWRTRLSEARKEPNWPLFCKPLLAHKEFPGQVIRRYRDIIATAGLKGDFEVWCSQLVEFIAEYRCFVINRKVVGVRLYRGEVLQFPNPHTINQMVASWRDQPAAYTLDCGVVQNGDTVLVEVNDGHSAGDYGLAPSLYARFLEARWCELMGAEPKSYGTWKP